MFERLLWQSPHLLAAALLGAIVMSGAIAWLYWPQLRGASPPWRWALASLRAAAVIALLFSILRPVILRTPAPGETGSIVVLVDRSRSMSVVDGNARAHPKLVALAQAFGMIPASRSQDTTADAQPKFDLAAIRAALDAVCANMLLARGELDYARIAGLDVDAAMEHLNEVASDASHFFRTLPEIAPAKDAARRLAELGEDTEMAGDRWAREVASTAARIVVALERAQASADERLYSADPVVQAACNELAAASRLQLVERALLAPQYGILSAIGANATIFGFAFADELTALPLRDQHGFLTRLPTNAEGRGTDLTGALRRVRDLMQGQTIQSIVLLSDGNQVGGDPQLTTALGASGVPVFTISVAAPVKRDISIARLSAPRSALANERVSVRADIRAIGFAGQSLDVEMSCDSEHQERHVAVPAGEGARVIPVEFPLTLKSPGTHAVTVCVAPLPGEASAQNNSQTRDVSVIAHKIQVLLAGSGRWDYQYLRSMLRRAPWVQLSEQTLADAGAKLSASAEQILQQDVIVLNDVADQSLSLAQWQALVKFVEKRGGSVIIVPGDAKRFAALAQLAGFSQLLPFHDPRSAAWRIWSGDEPAIHLIPPPGEDIDAMKLAADTSEDRRRWNGLPAMYRFMPVVDPKPAVRALLVERDQGLPVLTEMRAEAGRAFFLGTNETWRWRGDVGERDQDQFFAQLIRYACEEPYEAHDGAIALSASPLVAEPGEPVRVRAKVPNPARNRAAAPTIAISRNGAPLRTQVLLPAGAAEAGRFETIVDDLEEGEFEFRLRVGDTATNATLKVHVHETYSAELANIAGDEARLQRIATASGGKMFRLEEIDQLPAEIRRARERLPHFVEYPLWNSPYLFATILGCLGTEWALRKRLGLA